MDSGHINFDCQTLYANLLAAHDAAKLEEGNASTDYVRTLFQTVKCDDVLDFQIIRDAYKCKLDLKDRKRTDRILLNNQKTEDAEVAAFVNSHYSEWVEGELVSTLHGKALWNYQKDKLKRKIQGAWKRTKEKVNGASMSV